MKNIALVGFMGTGKSAVAAVLAEKLGMRTVSTDEIVVSGEGGKPVHDIFKEKGESYFRQKEAEAVTFWWEVSRDSRSFRVDRHREHPRAVCRS